MRTICILLLAIGIAGCAGIPKPDWNPGSTKPEVQTGDRPTCDLSSRWVWSIKMKDWVCVPLYLLPPFDPMLGPVYPRTVYPLGTLCCPYDWWGSKGEWYRF